MNSKQVIWRVPRRRRKERVRYSSRDWSDLILNGFLAFMLLLMIAIVIGMVVMTVYAMQEVSL